MRRIGEFLRAHPIPGVGLLLGPLLTVASFLMEAYHWYELGLPALAWAAIGSLVFFLSVIGILLQWWSQAQEASTTATVGQSPDQRVSKLLPLLAIAFGLIVVIGGVAWLSIRSTGSSELVTQHSAVPARPLEDKEASNTLKFPDWSKYRFMAINGRTFRNERVALDGNSFTNCTFINVSLEYNGTAPVQVINSGFFGSIVLVTSNPAVIGAWAAFTGVGFAKPEAKVFGPEAESIQPPTLAPGLIGPQSSSPSAPEPTDTPTKK